MLVGLFDRFLIVFHALRPLCVILMDVMTLPTSGGAVTSVTNCCVNCVDPAPSNGCPIYRFFGQAGHADRLDGRRCSSQKRVMSRLILFRQFHTNESGFVISAINKYMLGSRYL